MGRSSPRDAALVRRGVLSALPAAYLGFALARAEGGHAVGWLLVVGALAVGFLSAGAAPPEDATRRPVLLATSLVLASAAFRFPAAWVALVRDLAALTLAGLAARSLGRLPSEPGLAAEATHASAGAPLGRLALAGTAAAVAPWAGAVLYEANRMAHGQELGALGATTATVSGGLSLLAVAGVALACATMRRHELFAPPRALAAAGIALSAFACAAIASLATASRADTAFAVATVPLALGTGLVCRVRDVTRLARRSRRAVTLVVFGGPVVSLAAGLSLVRPDVEGALALAVAATALALGTFLDRLEEPLLPGRGALLDALRDAARASRDRDPRSAVARALLRLREAAGTSAVSPELWMTSPARVLTVDAAGYVHERAAELPGQVLDLAAAEPCATLRRDVLAALEVRRPDLRPATRWLELRDALAATVIAEGDVPDGLLVFVAGGRAEGLTVEEVTAMKETADAFVAICQAEGARARGLERERQLKERVDALEDAALRREHEATLVAGRHALASMRLARPATVGVYAAASRMAYEALEKRVAQGAPAVVTARAGIDPVPYLARAHLAGPRRDGPLVIVDGTSSREHALERWRDPAVSPLALADGGLLVLVDGAALPREVQVLVARALGERRPPWERATPLDLTFAFTAVKAPEVLTEEGRLAPELHARIEDAPPVELPSLADRAEDLRAIVADRLAREGLRVRGAPLGLDATAFAMLVEHAWDGEDAELASLVTRLAARAEGDVVRAADLLAVGFAPTAPADEAPSGRAALRPVRSS